MKIMTFHLAGELCAVELPAVHAVRRVEESDVQEAAPVVDLAERLGWGGFGRGDGALLELRADGRAGLVRVDRLGEVLDVPEAEVRQPPRLFASPLLRGVAMVEERLVAVVDAVALLRSLEGTGATAQRGAGR